MKHEEHGEMPVYDKAEVEKHEKLGWKFVNEGHSIDREKPEVEKRKPGRQKKD
jgi:hypothetical protein